MTNLELHRRTFGPMWVAAGITLAGITLGCPSADREKTTDPGPADGGETGAPAAPATPDTEALEAKLEEAESARMSCEAELAECKGAQ